MKTERYVTLIEDYDMCKGCLSKYDYDWDDEPCKSCEIQKPTNYEEKEE